jgi:protein-S-isoprenylcysteine O-methyltransferase Ste14
LFVAYITARQIVPEEKALVDLFGDRYLAYAASVPRWIGWRSSSGDRRQRDDG